jgi:hypothetical protein
LEDIINQIGFEKLESYIDKSALIESVSKDDLIALLSDIEDLGDIVDLEKALEVVDKDLLLKHVDKNAIYGEVDLEDAIELLGGFENASKYVDIDGLLADSDLDMGVLTSVVNVEKLVEKIGLSYDSFRTLYGEEKLADAMLYAKDLKDRYTVLWTYYDIMTSKEWRK